MPARTERLYLYPAEPGQPGQVIPFPLWWDRAGFFEQFGDRRIDTGHPLYVDYGILLTPGEALAWDQSCRTRVPPNKWDQNARLTADMQQLESALKTARWIIVESSEWESGLS